MGVFGSLDFFLSVDLVVCLAVGVLVGWLAGQFMKGGGFGLITNILLGAIGAVLSGYLFDILNVIDLGDLLDPVFAGFVGAVIVLGVASLVPRQRLSRRQG